MMKCRRFTLVELLVALGVFSVLMVVFMQLFSTMRLAWTNTQRRTDANANVRVAMDMISTLVGSAYLFNVPETSGSTVVRKLFPFKLTRASGGDAVGLYFASNARLDLPGSAPTRFVGILFPNPAHKLGLTESGTADEKEKAKKDLNKLYLVIISNTSENAAVNQKIYHWFWPSPDLMKAENTVADNTAEAMDTLESKLKAKVVTTERVKLADNVTEFSVRLFKEDGTEADGSATATYTVPDSLEIRISVLSDGDYDTWVGLKGGPEKTETSGSAAETFRTAKQLTFTRRIHIGDRWSQSKGGVVYDTY